MTHCRWEKNATTSLMIPLFRTILITGSPTKKYVAIYRADEGAFDLHNTTPVMKAPMA
jgi:hypothetical protein